MRLRKFVVFLVALLLTSCSPAIPPVAPGTQTVQEVVRDSTVAFVTTSLKSETTYPYCTGVWISRTTILTALHCAVGAANREEIRKLPIEIRPFGMLLITKVKNPTGITMNYVVESEVTGIDLPPTKQHSAKVISVDLTHDLALLKMSSDMPHHSWLPIANALPKVGDKIFVLGHPGGLYYTWMDGMVSAVRDSIPHDEDDVMEGPFVQVFSGIFAGNSGGPIVSTKGEIIGIVSFTFRAPNQGFGIATTSINNFLARALPPPQAAKH